VQGKDGDRRFEGIRLNRSRALYGLENSEYDPQFLLGPYCDSVSATSTSSEDTDDPLRAVVAAFVYHHHQKLPYLVSWNRGRCS